MSDITVEVHHHRQAIRGVSVLVKELIWHNGTHTWAVFHIRSGKCLNDDIIDHQPTDDEIVELIQAHVGYWACQGCGHLMNRSDADMIREHASDCDLYQFVEITNGLQWLKDNLG